VVPEGFTVLKEGQASVLLRGNEAFYNEAQVCGCGCGCV